MRHWTLEEATAALPRVGEIVRRVRALTAQRRVRAAAGGAEAPSSNGQRARPSADEELRELLEELSRDGIVVRDPERGLVDFPARAPSGRTYLLCWLDGEDAIEWWHWPEAGFAGRTPLSDPPA